MAVAKGRPAAAAGGRPEPTVAERMIPLEEDFRDF